MLFSATTALGLVAIAAPAFASHANLNRAEHHALAQRAPGTVAKRDQFNNVRYTFFDTGLGACGIVNTANQFIVALNQAQYEEANHCFKMIEITVNGKTATAQITDECPGCPYGGLDMSTGLFNFFADPSVGVLTGSWHFKDGSGGGNGGDDHTTSTTPKPKPTPTPTPTSTWTPDPTTSYTPTTTWTPPPPPPPETTSTTPSSTSTKEKTTSQVFIQVSSSSSSSSSSTSSKSTTSSTPKPSTTSTKSTSTTSATPTPTGTQISAVLQAVLGMGELAAVGRA